MNADVVRRLLSRRPFQRFVLSTWSGHEYEVASPEHWRMFGDDVVVRSCEGMTNIVDLKLVESIRIDEGFGFDELEQMWK